MVPSLLYQASPYLNLIMFVCYWQTLYYLPNRCQPYNMQKFGQKLRTLRTHHNMSLHDLALALNLTSRSYISQLETGKKMPTAELVLKAARLFHVTTDQLMKDELELDTEKTSTY